MKLFSLMHTLISPTLAGIGVIAVLVMGMDGWKPIVIAAVIGALISFPIAWVAAQKIRDL